MDKNKKKAKMPLDDKRYCRKVNSLIRDICNLIVEHHLKGKAGSDFGVAIAIFHHHEPVHEPVLFVTDDACNDYEHTVLHDLFVKRITPPGLSENENDLVKELGKNDEFGNKIINHASRGYDFGGGNMYRVFIIVNKLNGSYREVEEEVRSLAEFYLKRVSLASKRQYEKLSGQKLQNMKIYGLPEKTTS